MRVMGGVRCMPVPGTHQRYWAGEDGSIWSAAYRDKRSAWHDEHEMRQRLYGSTANTKDRGEYRCVNLTVNGVAKKIAVHRLVAAAWLPNYHHLLEVHHVNGDPLDNRPANLACMTRAEHERAHGRDVTDYDIVNSRYDFELHKDGPVPDRFAKRKRKRKKSTRAHAKSVSVGIMQTIRAAENLERRIEQRKE